MSEHDRWLDQNEFEIAKEKEELEREYWEENLVLVEELGMDMVSTVLWDLYYGDAKDVQTRFIKVMDRHWREHCESNQMD